MSDKLSRAIEKMQETQLSPESKRIMAQGLYDLGITSPAIEKELGISAAIDEDPLYEDLLLLEPREVYDKCILGVVRRFSSSFVLYSKRCVLESLAIDIDGEEYGDRYEQAIEHFEFNMAGAWVGEATPGYLEDAEDG